MNEYHEQAKRFLNENNLKLTIKEAETQEPAPWSDGVSGLKYDVSLASERGTYYFKFWGSINDRQKGKKPTPYDVLAALDLWEGSIDEFVSDFGYTDEPISKVLSIYNAVVDQTLQLKHILDHKAQLQLELIR